jgi:inorganic pyrophosphatase
MKAMAKKVDPFNRLPAFTSESEIHVVIETPKGCRTKFKWEPKVGLFTLHKVLPAGMTFPLDFGFVPGTLGADGDPLDVLLISDEPTFTGCLVTARLLGVLEAEQQEKGKKPERNDRLFAVTSESRDHSDTKRMKDVNAHERKELEQFFVNYNELENRKFKALGYRGRGTARSLIEKGKRAKRRA